MKRLLLGILFLFIGLNYSYAQVDVPYVSGGPIGSGSWLRFTSGGGTTSIQENWGLNLTGTNTQPVKVYNASLLVGYTPAGNTDFGVGNAFINGNVGIGTTTNLNGVFNVTIPVAKTSTLWSNPNNAAFFQTNDAANPFALRVQIVGDPALNNRFASLQTTDISLADGGNLLLQPANGNVGIRTTSPHTPLEITGGGTTSSISNTATTVTTRINTANPAVSLGIGYVASDNPMLQAFNNVSNSANSLLINPYGGSVGIGVIDPGSYQLAVNGTIHSKEVIIDLIGWPDYVFRKDYQLIPLAQVKSYIEQNQHLPDMPAAATVEKDGINLGEMNKALLRKVEEMTLYLIEKDKENKEQQKQIDNLAKRLTKLEKNNNSSSH